MGNFKSPNHIHDIQRQHDDWDEVHNQLLAIQKKSLEVSNPNDADEQEADEVARKVSSGESAQIHGTGGTINRKGSGSVETTNEFQVKLENKKGSGQKLDDSTRSEMESKMGADFSNVNIHTGSEASNMSESINAKAFTHGQDVFFKDGEFDTSSKQGKELLAHELTHTVQQSGGKVLPGIQRKINIQFEGDPVEAPVVNGKKKKKKGKEIEPAKITYTPGMAENDAMNDFVRNTVKALNMINAGELGVGKEFITNLTATASDGFVVRIVANSLINPDATKFGEPNLSMREGGTLYWNQNMGVILSDPYIENAGTVDEKKNFNMSPVRMLLHELDHANQLNFIRPIVINLNNLTLTDKNSGLDEAQKEYLQKFVAQFKAGGWTENQEMYSEIGVSVLSAYNGQSVEEKRVMTGSETTSGKKMKEGTRTDYEVGITGVYKAKTYNFSEQGIATGEEQKLIDEENARIKSANEQTIQYRNH